MVLRSLIKTVSKSLSPKIQAFGKEDIGKEEMWDGRESFVPPCEAMWRPLRRQKSEGRVGVLSSCDSGAEAASGGGEEVTELR